MPDPGDGRGAHPDPFRQAAGAPVGRVLRLGQGLGQDPLPKIVAVHSRPARMRRIGEAGEALFLEPPTPQQDGRDLHTELFGDVDVGDTVGRPQDDPSTHHGALLGRARPGHRPQGFSFGLTHSQRRGMSSHDSDSTPIRSKNQAHYASRH